MSYTLQQFSADCRAALEKDAGPDGIEVLRQCVEKACNDTDFVATHLGLDNTDPRKVLYEDPDLKFCVLTHVHTGARSSPPHDHGPNWAIYGQAAGTTEMTDWLCVKKPTADEPGLVKEIRRYELTPGMACTYQVGDLHSPHRDAETRLLRIEGKNMDGVARDAYMVAPA